MLYEEAKKESRVEWLMYEDYQVLEQIYLNNSFKDQPQFWEWFHMMCRMLGVEPFHFVLALRFCHDVILVSSEWREVNEIKRPIEPYDPTDGFC